MADGSPHTLDVSEDARWDARAAEVLAVAIDQAARLRGCCLLGLSGGSSPTQVFRLLGRRRVDWSNVAIVQVDERLAPIDSGERNLKAQREALAAAGASWLPLPVDELLAIDDDPARLKTDDEAVVEVLEQFSTKLVDLAGSPPQLDVVHLGLGVDGHTASLFPGDPLVDELKSYVGMARPSCLTPRLSLTRACLDRARMGVWLVAGSEKAPMLSRLVDGDRTIPAGLIRPAHSVILADRSAARLIQI